MRSWFSSKLAARTAAASSSSSDDINDATPASAAGGFGSVEDFSAPRSDPRVTTAIADAVPSAAAVGAPRRSTAMSLERHFQESFRVGTSNDGNDVDNLLDGNLSVQTEDFLAVLANDDDQSQASSALLFDESKYSAEDDDDDDDDDSKSLVSSNSNEWKAMHASKFLHDMMVTDDDNDDDDNDDQDDNENANASSPMKSPCVSSSPEASLPESPGGGSDDDVDVDGDNDGGDSQHSALSENGSDVDNDDDNDDEAPVIEAIHKGSGHASASSHDFDDDDEEDHHSHSGGQIDDDEEAHEDDHGEGSYDDKDDDDDSRSHGSQHSREFHVDHSGSSNDGSDDENDRGSQNSRMDGGSHHDSGALSEASQREYDNDDDDDPSQAGTHDPDDDRSYSQHSEPDGEHRYGGPPHEGESDERSDASEIDPDQRSRTSSLDADEGYPDEGPRFESSHPTHHDLEANDESDSCGSSHAASRQDRPDVGSFRSLEENGNDTEHDGSERRGSAREDLGSLEGDHDDIHDAEHGDDHDPARDESQHGSDRERDDDDNSNPSRYSHPDGYGGNNLQHSGSSVRSRNSQQDEYGDNSSQHSGASLGSRNSGQDSYSGDRSQRIGSDSQVRNDDDDELTTSPSPSHEESEGDCLSHSSEQSRRSQQIPSDGASAHGDGPEAEGSDRENDGDLFGASLRVSNESSHTNGSDDARDFNDESQGTQEAADGSNGNENDERRHDSQASQSDDASQPQTDAEGDDNEDVDNSNASPAHVESNSALDDDDPVELTHDAADDEHEATDGSHGYHDSRLSMDSDGDVEFRRKSQANHGEESVSSMGDASITLEDLASPMPGAATAAASPHSHATRSAHRHAPMVTPQPIQAARSQDDKSGTNHSNGSPTASERSDPDVDGSQSGSRDSRYRSGEDGSYQSEDETDSDPGRNDGHSQRSECESSGSDGDSRDEQDGDYHDSRISEYPTSDGSDADESQSHQSYESDSRHLGFAGGNYGGNVKFQRGGGANQYSDDENSNHIQGSTLVSSRDSYDDGSFGNSRDMLSLESNSVHSAHHGSPSGRVDDPHHGSPNDGAMYEFDLEKVISEPSERRRGVRRNPSFTQSFSSVNSDDSNVFGLSKLRRRGGRRTSNLRLPPQQPPTDEPAPSCDLSSKLLQPEQITMEASFEDDDVSRLGESFGASQANFGESFANADFAYRNSPGPRNKPVHEQIIEASEGGDDLRSVDDESDSTLSQARNSVDSERSGQSHSYGSEGDVEEQTQEAAISDHEEYEDDDMAPESDASGSTQSEAEARSPSYHEDIAEAPEPLALKLIQSQAEPVRKVAGGSESEACGPVFSTAASADTTAPLSEHSFSSYENDRSIGSSSSGAAKLAMAKALQFLSSDLNESPKAEEHPLTEAMSEAFASDEADVTEPFKGQGDDPSRSESEGLSDDDSHSDESDDPAKLVIREAPLLRLENVTAQTRSTIPESKLKHKGAGAGSGGWGWFQFGKKGANPVPAAKGVRPQDSGPAEPTDSVQGEADVRSSHADLSAPTSVPDNIQNREIPKPEALDPLKAAISTPASNTASEMVRADVTTVAVLQHDDKAVGAPVSLSPKDDQTRQLVKCELSGSKAEGNLINVSEAAVVSTRPARENIALATHVNSSTPESHLSVGQPEKPVPIDRGNAIAQMLTKDTASSDANAVHKPSTGTLPASSRVQTILLQASTDTSVSHTRGMAALSPSSSPKKSPELSPSKRNKKKKSKESKGLTSHLERRTRKTNRHGDEVSVGTMNVQPPKPGAQFLVPTIFEEASAVVEKRPWENALAKIKPQKLVQEPTIDVDELCLNAAVDAGVPLPVSPVRVDNTSVEIQDDTENACDVSPGERAVETNVETVYENGDSDSDDLMSLQGLQELEMKFGDSSKEVDFEDMWDNVDCDSKTRLEFEEKRRGKEREKEKKRTHRAKSKAAKRAKATRRLRLFEKQEVDIGYASKQSVALSNELLSALHRVFDEESAVADDDAASVSDDDETFAAETTDGTLHQTGASVVSLYLNTDRSVVRGIPEVTKESDDEDDDDESNAEMETSVPASKTKCKPRIKKSGKKGKDAKLATRTRRPPADPAAIFEAELKRQQRFKALSVSNLRQEMSDRRGTSVRLIQKEFAERKSKRGSFALHGQASPRQSFVNGNLHSTQNLFAGMNDASDPFASAASPAASGSPWRRSPRRVAAGRVPSNFDQVGKSPSNAMGSGVGDPNFRQRGTHLASHMSMWEVGDHVTDLDDLLTVQMSPVRTNFFSAAADMATQAASHLPSVPDLPPIPNLSVPTHLPSMPSLPNLPSMPNLPNLPHVSIPSGGGGGGGGNFGFTTTFADMPLSTINERADDENEAGLLDGRWDDDDERPNSASKGGGSGRPGVSGAGGGGKSSHHNGSGGGSGGGGGGSSGRFSFKVPKPALPGGMEKGLVKLKSVKRLLPKLPPLRGGGDGMMMNGRQQMLDDDDRGLLG